MIDNMDGEDEKLGEGISDRRHSDCFVISIIMDGEMRRLGGIGKKNLVMRYIFIFGFTHGE